MVVLGVDAAVNVILMLQVKLMSAVPKFGSLARYRFQFPFTESPVKTEAKVDEPFGAASKMVPDNPTLL